jgi:hypothetical protein
VCQCANCMRKVSGGEGFSDGRYTLLGHFFIPFRYFFMGKNRVVFDFFPGDEELFAAEFHRIDCCNLYLVLASLLPHCTTAPLLHHCTQQLLHVRIYLCHLLLLFKLMKLLN